MELLFYAVHQFSGYFRKIPGAGRVLVPAVSRECLCKVQQRRASLQSVFGIVVHEYFLDGHFLVLEDFVVLHQFLQFGFEIYRRISGPLYLQRFFTDNILVVELSGSISYREEDRR